MSRTKTTPLSMWTDHVQAMSKVRREHRERMWEHYRQLRADMQDRMNRRLDQSVEKMQQHNDSIQAGDHHEIIKHNTQMVQMAHQYGVERIQSNIELTQKVQNSWRGLARSMVVSLLGFAALSGVKANDFEASNGPQLSRSMSIEAVKAAKVTPEKTESGPQRGGVNFTKDDQKSTQNTPQRGGFNFTKGDQESTQNTPQRAGFDLKAKVSKPAKPGFSIPSEKSKADDSPRADERDASSSEAREMSPSAADIGKDQTTADLYLREIKELLLKDKNIPAGYHKAIPLFYKLHRDQDLIEMADKLDNNRGVTFRIILINHLRAINSAAALDAANRMEQKLYAGYPEKRQGLSDLMAKEGYQPKPR